MKQVVSGLLAGLLLALSAAGAADESGSDQGWELISDRDGIQVYVRNREGSRLKAFRGVTQLEQADEYSAIAMLEDYDAYPRWLHMIDSAEEIGRQGPLRRWIRITTGLPWPLQDREAILRTDIVQRITPEEESLSIINTHAPERAPPNPDFIRFPEVYSEMKATRLGDDRVELRYEVVLDPGGYIPAWLMNLLMRDTPYFTLLKIRRMMGVAAYLGHYYEFLDGRGPGRPASLPPAPSFLYGHPPAAGELILAPEAP